MQGCVLGSVVVAFGLSGFVVPAQAAPSSCADRVGVEATIAAVEGREGTFRLKALAKDLATGDPLSAPQVFFRSGEEGTAKSELPGGAEIRWVASVDPANATATYRVETRCKGEVTSSQAVTLQLPK